MLFQKELNQDNLVIKGYQPGKILISGENYSSPVLLTPKEIIPFEASLRFENFEIDKLLELIPTGTEIIIIGCGETHQFLPQQAIKRSNELGLAIEVMATRQACHTFQVLSHDKRKIIALLYP